MQQEACSGERDGAPVRPARRAPGRATRNMGAADGRPLRPGETTQAQVGGRTHGRLDLGGGAPISHRTSAIGRGGGSRPETCSSGRRLHSWQEDRGGAMAGRRWTRPQRDAPIRPSSGWCGIDGADGTDTGRGLRTRSHGGDEESAFLSRPHLAARAGSEGAGRQQARGQPLSTRTGGRQRLAAGGSRSRPPRWRRPEAADGADAEVQVNRHDQADLGHGDAVEERTQRRPTPLDPGEVRSGGGTRRRRQEEDGDGARQRAAGARANR